jgi:hypothetical protein
MTFSTDDNGAFEAELDLSDYIGKKLKIEARKESFETTDVSYEIGQEDIEVNIEMMAILQVEQDAQVSTEPVDHEDENHFFTKIKLWRWIGAACVIIIAIIVVYLNVRSKHARIISFYAEPTTIRLGSRTTLHWKTENAESVSISGIGRVGKSGSRRVKPAAMKTYTLTARGKKRNNVDKKAIKVSVRPIPILPAHPMLQPNQ